MIVRESIHNGDYRNVRTQKIDPTFAGIVALLEASPYRPRMKTLEGYVNNRSISRLAADLLSSGRGEFGWATYEVVVS